MVVPNLTDVVFRFINFAVISSLMGYVGIKYGLPNIKSAFAEKLKKLVDLKEMHNFLHQKTRIIEDTIRSDMIVQKSLKEKHALWQAALAKQTEEYNKIKSERAKLLASIVREQIKQVQEDRIFHIIMPDALQEARDQLKKKFADDQEQKSYMKPVLLFIEKESHVE